MTRPSNTLLQQLQSCEEEEKMIMIEAIIEKKRFMQHITSDDEAAEHRANLVCYSLTALKNMYYQYRARAEAWSNRRLCLRTVLAR